MFIFPLVHKKAMWQLYGADTFSSSFYIEEKVEYFAVEALADICGYFGRCTFLCASLSFFEKIVSLSR